MAEKNHPYHDSDDLSRWASGPQTHTRVTCPRCGEEFEKLPLHLRVCDGGGSDD
jgi:hypothetical protein